MSPPRWANENRWPLLAGVNGGGGTCPAVKRATRGAHAKAAAEENAQLLTK